MEQALGNNQITLIRQFVEEIEGYQSQIDSFNDDKRDAFKRASNNGLNKNALKIVIKERRRDVEEVRNERDAVDLYHAALDDQRGAGQLPLGAAEPKGPPAQETSSGPNELEGPQGVEPDPADTEGGSAPPSSALDDDGEGGVGSAGSAAPPDPSPAPAPARAREEAPEDPGEDGPTGHETDHALQRHEMMAGDEQVSGEGLPDMPAFLRRGTPENDAIINGEDDREPVAYDPEEGPIYEGDDEPREEAPEVSHGGLEASEPDPGPSQEEVEGADEDAGGEGEPPATPPPAIPETEVEGLFGDS